MQEKKRYPNADRK